MVTFAIVICRLATTATLLMLLYCRASSNKEYATN